MVGTEPGARVGIPTDLRLILVRATALFSAVAGVGHLSAARDHPAHAHITAFFVVVALAQLGWAAALTSRPHDRRLLRLGLAGNAAVVGIWAVSRTTGIPLIAGATGVEPVAVKDAVTTFVELLALGAGGLALTLPAGVTHALVASAERATAVLVSVALLLALPVTLGPNGHGTDHGEHGHGTRLAEEAAHTHGSGGDADGHAHEADQHASGTVLEHHTEHVDMPARSASHAGHAAEGAAATGGSSHGHAGDEMTDGHGTAGHEGHHDDGATGASTPPGQVTSIRYGPFPLPPASTNGVRHDALISNTVLTQLPPPCRDCYLTEVNYDLVYGDGKAANYDTGAMLHHHVMFNSGEEDPTCGRWDTGVGFLGRRILAAGNERTTGSFPSGFGYHVGANDWWSGIFELMNMEQVPQTVYVDLTVRYLPGDDESVKGTEPVWVDIDNCEDSELDIPAGPQTVTWDWPSNMTGRVVLTAGHVHDGGLSTTLANATTGSHMCRSVAGYETKPAFEGHIESMGICSWDRLGAIREGDTVRLTASYNAPQTVEGGMGIMMFWVYETEDLTGGTPAPDSMTSPPEGAAPTTGGHTH